MVIKSIEESSGARLKIGEDTTICSFRGSPDQVAEAMSQVQAILDHNSDVDANQVTKVVEVGDKIPAVMGKKGANIRKIVEESQAMIKTNRENNSIVVSGDGAQVQKALELIHLYMSGGPPPEAREEVELGSERGRFVVLGKQGSTIRAIQEETGARLTMERGSTFVLVEGETDQVAMAVAQLHELIDMNAFTIMVPANGHVPAVIGKGGATIRNIRDQSGAAVDLLDGNVKLTGTEEQVSKAKVMVDKIIAEEVAGPWSRLGKGEVCEEMNLGDAVGMVIGRHGIMINKIKDESGANIDIARGQAVKGSGTLCRVYGKKEAVAKATEEIKKIITNHQEMNERRAKFEAIIAERKAAEAAKAQDGDEDVEDEGLALDDAGADQGPEQVTAPSATVEEKVEKKPSSGAPGWGDASTAWGDQGMTAATNGW